MSETGVSSILERVGEEKNRQNRCKKQDAIARIRSIKEEIISVPVRDPLHVFPEEIWGLIFRRLSIQNDVSSCFRTCSQFQRLVNRDAKYVRFLPVLHLISTYLSKLDILSCRLVCKHWSDVIDKWMETPVTRFEFATFEKRISLPTSPTTAAALKSMENHSRNPFRSKRVRLNCGNGRQPFTEEIWLQIKSFFESFGVYIHHLNFWVQFSNLDNTSIHQLLLQVLTKCPNLKTLHISGMNISYGITSNPNEPRLLLMDHPNLEDLSWFSGSPTNSNLCVALEQYYGQLKNLEVTESELNPHLNLDWTNLESLSFQNMYNERAIVNLQRLKAPGLKQLSMFHYNCSVKISNLIRTAVHFPNLRKLYLRLGKSKSLEMSNDQIARISRIKHLCSGSVEEIVLKMDYLAYLASFDFLLFFPQLKVLTLYILNTNSYELPAKEYGLVIKLIDPSKPRGLAVYESNVWQVCRRLEKVKAGRMLYTRAHYEMSGANI